MNKLMCGEGRDLADTTLELTVTDLRLTFKRASHGDEAYTLYVQQIHSVNAHSFQYRNVIREENSRLGKINKYTYKKRSDQ